MPRNTEEKGCANCGTLRYPLKSKQLCARCYYVQRKIEKAPQEIPDSLVESYKRECERRLGTLKMDEQRRKGPISGLDVEHKLIWLAEKSGVRRKKLSLFRGRATLINEYFQPEQKRVLYGLLSDIEENVPWAGVDLAKVVSGSIEG